MNYTVMELVENLVELRTKRDDILYPALDNKASARLKCLVELSVMTEWCRSLDEIKSRFIDEIVKVEKELRSM